MAVSMLDCAPPFQRLEARVDLLADGTYTVRAWCDRVWQWHDQCAAADRCDDPGLRRRPRQNHQRRHGRGPLRYGHLRERRHDDHGYGHAAGLLRCSSRRLHADPSLYQVSGGYLCAGRWRDQPRGRKDFVERSFAQAIKDGQRVNAVRKCAGNPRTVSFNVQGFRSLAVHRITGRHRDPAERACGGCGIRDESDAMPWARSRVSMRAGHRLASLRTDDVQ